MLFGVIKINNKVAIYCRLSEEDRNKKNKDDDSGSIQNQKMMLVEYALKQEWSIFNIYSDDDYAGSDRNRPAFNQMLKDAEGRKFNIILCKTQSRFTRELEIVEKYIHNLFPQWGIRFISIVDNIDTDIAGNKKTRQINGLINEWYLEDMSDSIKAALKTRMRGGYHIGSFAPYGYKKDPDNKGKLIIDDEAADVVRSVFSLYNSGMGRTQIARILNERGIPNPSEYKRQKGIIRKSSGKSNGDIWKYATVSQILTNEVYIGNLVQAKTYNPTYKSKHTIPAPQSHWIKIENAHEPIIDMDTWNLTRRIWNRRTKPCYVSGTKDINVFAGKVICVHCGYNVSTGYNRGKRFFRCSTRKFDKNSCQGVTIFESTLKTIVLEEFKKLREQYLDTERIENGIELDVDESSKLERLQKAASDVDKRLKECDNDFKNLYTDKLRGLINDAQFVTLSSQFEEEKDKLLQQREKIESDIAYLQSLLKNVQTKQEIIERYLSFDELTQPMVEELIDKIEIGGEKRHRTVNIYWNF